MLRNRTYRGEIVHKRQSHPGEHTPIIDQPLWDAVQAQRQLLAGAAEIGKSWPELPGTRQRAVLTRLIERTSSASLSTMTSLRSCTRYPSGGTPPIHIPFFFGPAEGPRSTPHCSTRTI